jgi:hypothetical protein
MIYQVLMRFGSSSMIIAWYAATPRHPVGAPAEIYL